MNVPNVLSKMTFPAESFKTNIALTPQNVMKMYFLKMSLVGFPTTVTFVTIFTINPLFEIILIHLLKLHLHTIYNVMAF